MELTKIISIIITIMAVSILAIGSKPIVETSPFDLTVGQGWPYFSLRGIAEINRWYGYKIEEGSYCADCTFLKSGVIGKDDYSHYDAVILHKSHYEGGKIWEQEQKDGYIVITLT